MMPRALAVLLALLFILPAAAGLCTFYTDPKFPVIAPRVLDTSIIADVEDGYAVVEITKTFRNPDRFQQVGDIIFPLPSDQAFITALSLTVDGVEHEASVVEREEGRQRFSRAVDEQRDSSLLEHLGGSQYALRVVLPPMEDRTLRVRYEEPLWRADGVYSFHYPLTEEALSDPENLTMQVRVQTTDAFAELRVSGPDAVVDRPAPDVATVRYEATGAAMLAEDLGVTWSPASTGGARLLASGEDGFLLRIVPDQAALEDAPPMPIDAVVLVDASGSMAPHMEAAAAALEEVLGALDKDDRFRIATLRHGATSWDQGMKRAGIREAAAALDFVDGLEARGSTDLERALGDAMDMLGNGRPGAQPTIIILSDGLATSGLSEGRDLAHALGEQNLKTGRHVQVHAVQLGDVARQAVRFDPWGRSLVGSEPALDVVAREHHGSSSPAEAAGALAGRIVGPGRVLLRDAVVVAAGAADVEPLRIPLVEEGDEILVTGRFLDGGAAELVIAGTGRDGPAQLRFTLLQEQTQDSAVADRLGAMVRLERVLDDIRLWGETDDKVDEVLALAADYGYVTPYTSLLVDIPPAQYDAEQDSSGGTTPATSTAADTPTATRPPQASVGRAGEASDGAGGADESHALAIFRSPLVSQREYDSLVPLASPEHDRLAATFTGTIMGKDGGEGVFASEQGIVVVAGELLHAWMTGQAAPGEEPASPSPGTETGRDGNATADPAGRDSPPVLAGVLLSTVIAGVWVMRRRMRGD